VKISIFFSFFLPVNQYFPHFPYVASKKAIIFFRQSDVVAAAAVDRILCSICSLDHKTKWAEILAPRVFKAYLMSCILEILKFRFLRVPPCKGFWDFVKERFLWPFKVKCSHANRIFSSEKVPCLMSSRGRKGL
jgi:hypothetical protein